MPAPERGETRDLLTEYLSPTDPPPRVREARQLEGAQEQALEVQGHRVRVRVTGEGSTVLVLHGWSGGSDQMGFLTSALADAGHQVVLPDLPAHGLTDSFQADGTSSFFDFSKVITAIATRWPLHAIVGHSGGALAALMAMRDGAEVPTFVGIGMLPRLRVSVDRFLDLNDATAAEREAFEQSGRERFDDDIYARTNAHNAVLGLTVRALLIHDQNDEAVPIGDARSLADEWKNATLIETERYGHHLILRRADVIAEVVDFLKNDGRAN